MELLFSQVLNMSLTASVVIVLVMAVRLLLKRFPKSYSYALWSVVLFRLLCPVSFSAPVSVLEVTAPQVAVSEGVSVVYYEAVERVVEDSGWYRSGEAQSEPISVQELEQKQVKKETSPLELACFVWMAGMSLMLLYSLFNYLRLKQKLVGALHWRGEIYLADRVGMPFVLGVFRPKIYLPSGIPAQERRYIVAHERQHIKRLDPLWKLLGYSALCIHWFNPLVWLAFMLAGKDMEMSCDEAVIRKFGPEIRADYAASLLRLASPGKLFSGMPLAFGEGDTKGRVKNMANWKRPKIWGSILCGMICVVIALICVLNPEEEQSLGEMTHWEGPSSCAVGDLNYYLPEGCAEESVELMELNDWELKKVLDEKTGLYPYGVIFKEGETVTGGINSYYTGGNLRSGWIEELPLWEFDDDTLGHYGESSAICNYELEFFTDLPGDAPLDVHRKHYIFLSEDKTMAYDMWFDLLTVDKEIMEQILATCIVGGGSHKPVNMDAHAFEDLTLELPDYYVLQKVDARTANFMEAGVSLDGGVVAYDKPDFELKFSSVYPMEEWNLDEWLAAMGYEEDKTLAYMCGGSVYGDFERHYTSDVPEGQPITVDEHHTFFIRENYVYDVWFDMTKIDVNVRNAILQTVSGKPEESVPLLPAEEMFTEHFASIDGTVNISIDANIPSDLGNAGCSILESVPHYITEAEAERVARAIFGEDAEFFSVAPVFEKYNVTEKQLQSAIDRSSPYTTAESWEKLVGFEDVYGNSCEDLAEKTKVLVDYWQGQLDNFRCDYPEEVCDFTYQNDAYSFDAPGNASDEAVAESGESIAAWVEMDGYSYQYKVTTRDKDDFKLNNIYVTMEWPVSNSELDHRLPRREHCSVEPNSEQIGAVKQEASRMLNEMGLGYWIVDEVNVEKHTYNHPDIPEYIIRVSAVPIVDGVPAIRWGQHGNINTNSADKPVDNYYLPMADFEYAADGTLLGMTVMSPMKDTVISRTNTGMDNRTLLDIAVEELQKITINDCGLNVTEMGYHPVPRCDVEISNIRVGYARVRVAGTEDTYRYLPALALYGKKIYTFANGDKLDWMEQPENILTLNALDGSVITDMKNRITVGQ